MKLKGYNFVFRQVSKVNSLYLLSILTIFCFRLLVTAHFQENFTKKDFHYAELLCWL